MGDSNSIVKLDVDTSHVMVELYIEAGLKRFNFSVSDCKRRFNNWSFGIYGLTCKIWPCFQVNKANSHMEYRENTKKAF